MLLRSMKSLQIHDSLAPHVHLGNGGLILLPWRLASQSSCRMTLYSPASFTKSKWHASIQSSSLARTYLSSHWTIRVTPSSFTTLNFFLSPYSRGLIVRGISKNTVSPNSSFISLPTAKSCSALLLSVKGKYLLPIMMD